MVQSKTSALPLLLLLVAMVAMSCLPTRCAGQSSNAVDQEDNDDDDVGNLIVGGFKVSIEEVPYQAGVFRDNMFVCGGCIVGSYWIVTAQHCVPDAQQFRYAVLVGTDATSQGQKLSVAEVFLPPNDADNTPFDVSLLKLTNQIRYSSRVACIPMISPGALLFAGQPATVSGYGNTVETENGQLFRALKAAIVDVMDHEKCTKYYPEKNQVKPYQFCAGFDLGKVDSCQGDSGGPLVVDGFLVGITDWGIGCAAPYAPGVYMAVSSFSQWVSSIVKQQASPEEQMLC